jgi:hypothetical protein
MALSWRALQRGEIEAALRRFPAESGMCAALARVVWTVARPEDRDASGLQVRPRGAAPYILPRHPRVRVWHSHTLVRTREHHVDALTGVDGCEAGRYLESHWFHPEALQLAVVDVRAVDPGVQHDDE